MFCLRSCGLAALLFVGSTCAPGRQSCALPPVTGHYRQLDEVPVVSLPDSGGFLINGQSIQRARVGALLRDLFAMREPSDRAIMVWQPAVSRCNDVAFIAAQARAHGGVALAADSAWWPKLVPASVGRSRSQAPVSQSGP